MPTFFSYTNNNPDHYKPPEPSPGDPWWDGFCARPLGDGISLLVERIKELEAQIEAMVERIKELEAKVGPPTGYFIPDDGVFIEADGTVRRIKPGEG